ncbi:uncharacterized protein CIMG_07113 [Coccidioides immitis RS]|uniref:Uncharacterized protein n=3 Tax=Coccidioides immitis TaxID=5501 RepID=A0A0E1RWD4_COCIM|nr:uncharacterized protein CIMG_07113 [Coccidioides immitis RS]EAS31634.1 hypothetical protein CIMG_07113 [Coccidioides immitis RS]KMP04290.1 hypothetical protein CIRG_03981 [Coccidioides immitis RMSCC 2394]KMU73421.1 hypothetical protein CISG_03556 [Coccidioides immitis RMSCC 3703]
MAGGDVSQLDAILGKTSGLSSNREQSKISLDHVVKERYASDNNDVIPLTWALKSKYEDSEYNCIEMIDTTTATDSGSKTTSQKQPKTIRPQPPVLLEITTCW